MSTYLEGEKLQTAMERLSDAWAVLPGRGLSRVIPTDGLKTGVVLVAKIAEVAESIEYQPEVMLRTHEVELSLEAHNSGAVSESDIQMAEAIDRILG